MKILKETPPLVELVISRPFNGNDDLLQSATKTLDDKTKRHTVHGDTLFKNATESSTIPKGSQDVLVLRSESPSALFMEEDENKNRLPSLRLRSKHGPSKPRPQTFADFSTFSGSPPTNSDSPVINGRGSPLINGRGSPLINGRGSPLINGSISPPKNPVIINNSTPVPKKGILVNKANDVKPKSDEIKKTKSVVADTEEYEEWETFEVELIKGGGRGLGIGVTGGPNSKVEDGIVVSLTLIL